MTLIMGAFCMCTFLASLIFDLAICHPIQKNWQVKPFAGGKHLISVVGFQYAQLTVNRKLYYQATQLYRDRGLEHCVSFGLSCN